MADIEQVSQVIELIAMSMCKPRFGRLFAYPAEVGDAIRAAMKDTAIRAHILQSAWLKVGEHMPRPSQELLLLERGRDSAGRLFANQYFAELSTDGSAFLDPHNYEPIVALNNPNYELFWQPLPLPPTGGEHVAGS